MQIAVSNLHGLLQNKSSTKQRVLPIHQNDVQIVVQLKRHEWVTIEEDLAEAKDKCTKSLVQIVAKRTLCLSNHEVTSRFCAEIVLGSKKAPNKLSNQQVRSSF